MLPITVFNTTFEKTSKDVQQQKILEVDSAYLQLSSQENIEVVFGQSQPWLSSSFEGNQLIFSISDPKEVNVNSLPFYLRDKVTQLRSEDLSIELLFGQEGSNHLQKFVVIFLFTLFSLLCFVLIFLVARVFDFSQKRKVTLSTPQKNEEFLSNSIIQWNNKMKMRQRTLNLEEEEIHDENDFEKVRRIKSQNMSPKRSPSEENLEKLEDVQNPYQEFDEEEFPSSRLNFE